MRPLALFAFTVAVALSQSAAADEPRTWGARAAVLRFTGPGALTVEKDVTRLLGEHAAMVPWLRWQKVETRLARGQRDPQHMAAVAAALDVDVVVLGAVLKEAGHWQLRVALRDGATAHIRERLQYTLHGPVVDARTLAVLRSELPEAFERTLETAHKPAHPVAVTTTTPTTTTTATTPATPAQPQPEDDDTPPVDGAHQAAPAPVEPTAAPTAKPHHPAKSPATDDDPEGRRGRPVWAPYLEVAVGPLLSSRALDFRPPSQPRFVPGLAEGLHGDVTVYPLAGTYARAHGVLARLGVGATVDVPFWSNSHALVQPSYAFATHELRIEGGLRWRFVLRHRGPRPELIALVGGGLHSFTIQKLSDGTDAGPPDVAYQYLSLGLGFRIWPARRLSLELYGTYEVVLGAGSISSASEFGSGPAFGLRGEGRLRVRVWRGLNLGVSGFYERYQLSFTSALDATQQIANSAVDQYYGGCFLVGWDY